MKKVHSLIIALLILVLAVAFWLFWEEQSGLQTYENLKYGLSFKIPQEYKWTSQNSEMTVIFIKNDDFKNLQEDPSFTANPLLAVIQHKTKGYLLFILQTNFPTIQKDLEEYLTTPVGGVENGKFGEFEIALKNLKATSTNSYVYLYETEIKKKEPIKETGIAGFKNKTIFKLIPLQDNQYSEKEITEFFNLVASSLRIK